MPKIDGWEEFLLVANKKINIKEIRNHAKQLLSPIENVVTLNIQPSDNFPFIDATVDASWNHGNLITKALCSDLHFSEARRECANEEIGDRVYKTAFGKKWKGNLGLSDVEAEALALLEEKFQLVQIKDIYLWKGAPSVAFVDGCQKEYEVTYHLYFYCGTIQNKKFFLELVTPIKQILPSRLIYHHKRVEDERFGIMYQDDFDF